MLDLESQVEFYHSNRLVAVFHKRAKHFMIRELNGSWMKCGINYDKLVCTITENCF